VRPGVRGTTFREDDGLGEDFAHAAPPLAIALRGLDVASGARALMDWASAEGFRGISWDAASAGARPRELDRSARRDIAASLKRRELTLTGVDLPIPPAHFMRAERQDRAFEAARAALLFAAEVGGLLDAEAVVVMTLPEGEGAAEAIETLAASAERAGAVIGARNWPRVETSGEVSARRVGIALDPAGVLLAGADPTDALAGVGEDLAHVRVSDIASAGRVAPGEGRLSLEAYAGALGMLGWSSPATLDLEGVGSQVEAAARLMERWCAVSRRSAPRR
jgi:sugar phosphate isomerase/epimerase